MKFAIICAASLLAASASAAPFPQSHLPAQKMEFYAEKSKPAHAGWQKPQVGTMIFRTTLWSFFYTCPKKYPVAINGSFAIGGTGQTLPVYNAGSHTAEAGTAWEIDLNWPGGADQNTTVTTNAYCVAN